MALSGNAQNHYDTKPSEGAANVSNALVSTDYTNLGLSSGTRWMNSNAPGFYTYEEALLQFKKRLPTKAQWQELRAECQWTWTGNGYKVTGPNGNSIVLPAAGYRYCTGSVNGVGAGGDYWSSTPGDSANAWYLDFGSSSINVYNFYRCYGFSVRLVQN